MEIYLFMEINGEEVLIKPKFWNKSSFVIFLNEVCKLSHSSVKEL